MHGKPRPDANSVRGLPCNNEAFYSPETRHGCREIRLIGGEIGEDQQSEDISGFVLVSASVLDYGCTKLNKRSLYRLLVPLEKKLIKVFFWLICPWHCAFPTLECFNSPSARHSTQIKSGRLSKNSELTKLRRNFVPRVFQRLSYNLAIHCVF